jgi:type IV pilus assembly protein PilB
VRNRIGECLIQAGIISSDELQQALDERTRTGDRLGTVLVRLKFATEEQIATAVAAQLGFPYLSLRDIAPDPAAVALIPRELCLKRGCVAISLDQNVLTVAMSDPLLFSLVLDLEKQAGHPIREVVATPSAIRHVIETSYPMPQRFATSTIEDTNRTLTPGAATANLESDAPAAKSEEVTALLDDIFQRAATPETSDVHVEPADTAVRVRQRRGGMLKDVLAFPVTLHEALTARLKAMAGMDPAETRLPQSGRIKVAARNGDVDYRVSTLRSMYGETVVLSRLGPQASVPALDEIGMSPSVLRGFQRVLDRGRGMVVVAGPPGAGTSTTLAAAVAALRADQSRVAIVDPVEHRIPGVVQTEIDARRGLTTAKILRSTLEQDADVILVGETPDAETARLALQAADDGTLVLTAVRGDDAPSAVRRLVEIGVEADAVASSLAAIVGQRLVRRLCASCRRQIQPTADMRRSLNVADEEGWTFYEPAGCDRCSYTGYRGRTGVFELLRMTEAVRQVVAAGGSTGQIREAARAAGMVSLAEDGLAKMTAGITSASELLRLAGDQYEARRLCAHCGAALALDFNACPSCGQRLARGCPHCGRVLQPAWTFCPYCARNTAEPVRPKSGRERERNATPESGRRRPAAKVARFKKDRP